jgi:uncharacterized protein (TIGR02270 family)
MNNGTAQILSQHAEEAAFLWLLRANAVRAPHFLLKDLTRLDNRVEAHLDGLRVAGSDGWELCNAALAEKPEPGAVFAAAVLAFESGEAARLLAILKPAMQSPVALGAVVSALGWLPYPVVEPHVKSLIEGDSPPPRRLGIAAAAIHRQIPGWQVEAALTTKDPLIRARGFRAAGELGRADWLPLVQKGFNDADDRAKFWAAWSAGLLGKDHRPIEILRGLVEAYSPFRERAIQIIFRRLDLPAANSWRERLGNNPTLGRLAVMGAGIIGDPVAVPWLIEKMRVPKLARVAGEALSLITGVHISYDKLEGKKPDGFEDGPTESPKEDHVALGSDDNLYWPEPNLVAAWWKQNQGRFKAGTRHLLGKPISPESVMVALKNGYQRQRAAAALELALLTPGKPLFEVRASGFRQQEILDHPAGIEAGMRPGASAPAAEMRSPAAPPKAAVQQTAAANGVVRKAGGPTVRCPRCSSLIPGSAQGGFVLCPTCGTSVPADRAVRVVNAPANARSDGTIGGWSDPEPVEPPSRPSVPVVPPSRPTVPVATPIRPSTSAAPTAEEAAWLGGTDPGKMLSLLRGRISARKRRLFACACCRRAARLLTVPAGQFALEAAERFADAPPNREPPRIDAKSLGPGDADAAARYACHIDPVVGSRDASWHAAMAVVGRSAPRSAWEAERSIQADLLREIAGNPFQLIPGIPPADESVRALAQKIYENQLFDQLPALADRLEKAGCEGTAILEHCRGPGPHVRGCWVVDLLLDKS